MKVCQSDVDVTKSLGIMESHLFNKKHGESLFQDIRDKNNSGIRPDSKHCNNFSRYVGQKNRGIKFLINLWLSHQHLLHHGQTSLVGKDSSKGRGSKDLL